MSQRHLNLSFPISLLLASGLAFGLLFPIALNRKPPHQTPAKQPSTLRPPDSSRAIVTDRETKAVKLEAIDDQ